MPARRIDAIDTDGHVNSVPQGQNNIVTLQNCRYFSE